MRPTRDPTDTAMWGPGPKVGGRGVPTSNVTEAGSTGYLQQNAYGLGPGPQQGLNTTPRRASVGEKVKSK